MPRAPQDVYARLLSSPRGYPLWTPEPSNELLMERRDGLRIGDVGVVIPDDGGFDVFFNICLPRDHPFHHRYGVPESFRCIDQSELDIRTIPNAENPGRIISSSSVTQIEPAGSSSDPPQRDESSALAYRFRLSPSEGALLILPKGAQRYELLNDGLFLEQASRHGAEWYNYAINRRHRTISHDSLYLITGIYKTSSWSVAAFENATGKQHYTANFKQIGGDSAAPSYSWETTCALDWRVGPYVDYGIPNQAVFIRGFKIALRNGLLGTRRISVEADVPSTRSNPAKWTSIIPSNSRLFDGLARLTGNRGNNVPQTTTHNEGATDPNEEPSQGDASGYSEYDGLHVEIQRMPDVPPAFHPSDAINQYMLCKDPSANIAITHDSYWITMLEDGLLTPEELGQETRLETVLSENYRVVSHEGVLHLDRKGESDGLDENMPYATVETDPEEADELSALVDIDMREQLMEAAISVRDSWDGNDAITADRDPGTRYVCRWFSHGHPCDTPILNRDLVIHLHSLHLHRGPARTRRLTCLWDGCGRQLKRESIIRHVREVHFGLSRKPRGNVTPSSKEVASHSSYTQTTASSPLDSFDDVLGLPDIC